MVGFRSNDGVFTLVFVVVFQALEMKNLIVYSSNFVRSYYMN